MFRLIFISNFCRKEIKTELSPDVDPISNENEMDEPQAGPSGLSCCSAQIDKRKSAQQIDDSQPGPSGINVRPSRDFMRGNRHYADGGSSSDDDDDHEIMQTTSLWRSRGQYNLSQSSREDENRRQHEASDSGAGNIDSEMEILTAPDLQLDWLSDSSEHSIDEVVCVPCDEPTPPVENSGLKTETSSSTIQANATTSAQTLEIDLTRDTDDEEDLMEINICNGQPPSRSNRVQNALFDVYHNATRERSMGGSLNCRSAFGTCDCLETGDEAPPQSNSAVRPVSADETRPPPPPMRARLYPWYEPQHEHTNQPQPTDDDVQFVESTPPRPFMYHSRTNQNSPAPPQPQQLSNGNVASSGQDGTTNGNASTPANRSMTTPVFLNPHTGNYTSARSQAPSRCPFMYTDRNRRSYHCNMVHHNYPYLTQNGAYHNVRPAYAPHENLWYRQMSNQEVYRRHLMNHMSGVESTNFNTPPTSQSPTGSVYCHQHPSAIGRHQPPHHRCLRTYVCPENRRSRYTYIGR